MNENVELASIEADIREILALDLPEHRRADALGDLILRRRSAFARCSKLLREYSIQARGKTVDEAEVIIVDLLSSMFDGISTLMFAAFMHGTYARPNPLRPFPIPSLPSSGQYTHGYKPRR